MGRGLKAQMKYANKIGAKFTCVIGDDDIENGTIKIKNMETGETIESGFPDFAETFENAYISYIELKEFPDLDINFEVEENE